MKVIGTNDNKVLVELTMAEWQAIGGHTYVSGYTTHPKTAPVPDVRNLADAVRKIQYATPDLQHIRAAFKSFLMLTEPAAVQEVLKSCGVAEVVQEPAEKTEESDEEEE